MITQTYVKKKFQPNSFVNTETGEDIQSETGASSYNVPTGNYMISSDEYIIIDSKAKRYVESMFNQAECGRIFKMTDMVYGCYNILYKGDIPHTKDTLSEELEYTRNKMALFLKKLLKENIIYYLSGYADDKPICWIMLNPTLARKSKIFHGDCIKVFTDLSKKTPVQ